MSHVYSDLELTFCALVACDVWVEDEVLFIQD